MSNTNPPKNNADADVPITIVPNPRLQVVRQFIQQRRLRVLRNARRKRNTLPSLRNTRRKTQVTSPTLIDLYVGSHAGVPIHTDGSKEDPVTRLHGSIRRKIQVYPTLIDLYVGSHAGVPIHTDGSKEDPVII
jgi:hypothetical protein